MPEAVRPGFALWLTGLPSSGKTTLAHTLARFLKRRGIPTQILDSDSLRRWLTPHPTYSRPERDWFYRSLALLVALFVRHGQNVLIAATASRRAYRREARNWIARFGEVYVECPLEVCQARDPKGLWERARRGEIAHLPGAGAPYQPPIAPEARVNTALHPPHEAACTILQQLEDQGFFPPIS
jgi:adenylylsulfate kinase